MPSVKFSDLELAFEFVSSAPQYEATAFISRETGKIYWLSDVIDEDEEETPDDLENRARYIEIPNKNEFNLGKRLVLRFIGEELLEEYDEVERIFSRAGAYGRYKELLESKGLPEAWYKYEEEANQSSLRAWCEEEGIQFVDEKGDP